MAIDRKAVAGMDFSAVSTGRKLIGLMSPTA